MSTLRALLALLVLLAVLPDGPGTAVAQVAAPRLVEEGDEQPEAPAPRAEPALPDPATSAHPARDVPTHEPAPPARAEPDPGRRPEPHVGSEAPALPPPPPPPTAAEDLARRIVPVQARWETILAAWTERRAALREGDPARAEAAQRALLAAKADLAIENLVPFAVAEVRESARALQANLPAEALARADAAAALAPDLPDGHLARARALFAQAPGAPLPVLGAVSDGLAAAAREPQVRRAFLGDVLTATLAAVAAAGAAVVVLLLLRSMRLFLHDFHHLPVLRGSARVQAAVLGLVLLAMPLAFGLGPLAALGVAALAAWLYLSGVERLVVTAALAALTAAPWGLAGTARLTAWSGTLAERVYEIEHGAVSDAEAAELVRLAPSSEAPAPLLAALGRHAKRRGDLEGALRLYREALAADPRAAGIPVNIANALLLRGDLDGAKAAYLAAQDGAGGDRVVLAAAHYGLSKLYLRTSEMEKSAAAREKAEQEAGPFLRRHGSDDDFSANRYLVDVPVPPDRIAALAVSDGMPDAVLRWARGQLLGQLPARLWPWGPVGFLAALWLLALLAPRLAPSRACDRCGRPACGRCDRGAGRYCGQCVNAFERKGVVDALDRLRKELQVRRHARLSRLATRALAVVGAGSAQVAVGATVRGAALLVAVLVPVFLIVLWRGVAPPPFPSPYVLAGKLALALPLGAVAWALAVRDAFRRTRS